MITIPRSVCLNLDQAVDKEWLVTNGIGGFASGTVTGINTRRYHGLLVAALKPPVERTMMLNNIEEELQLGDVSYRISANEYPDGRINPSGYLHVEEFRVCDNIPTTTFHIGDATVTKTVWMEHGHNTTYVQFSYVGGTQECRVALSPLCNYRDYHGITRGSIERDFKVETVSSGAKITAREGATPLWLTVDGASFTPTGVWYWNFVYRKEVERGYNDREDLYSPGVFRTTLQPGESVCLVASTEPPESTNPLLAGAMEREQDRQARLLEAAGVPLEEEMGEAADPLYSDGTFVAQLVRSADTFLVRRGVKVEGDTRQVPTVIAGYHWFTDWGRDTMISLPGLTVPTGRTAEAMDTLRTFARFVKEGLIPNNFPEAEAPPAYNTVDGTLWMFVALDRLTRATGDMSAAEELYPLLSDIIAWHVRGTLYGIKVDPEDGLLAAGENGVQLTWMDAKVDDWVVTPRTGKAVEINALWYNALAVMARLQGELKGKAGAGSEPEPDFGALAKQARESFRNRFWYAEGGYLYDVVDTPQGGNDSALRPNQVLALSLNPDLMMDQQAKQTLWAVRAYLLTPYGLRTLAPQDPQYKPRYEGDRRARDGAYHQGTVWAWLLGPYFDAVRAIEGEDEARAELKMVLTYLRAHMRDAGLGSISEIFDAEEPHTPKGCIAQAWSVAEVLRLVWGPDKLL